MYVNVYICFMYWGLILPYVEYLNPNLWDQTFSAAHPLGMCFSKRVCKLALRMEEGGGGCTGWECLSAFVLLNSRPEREAGREGKGRVGHA